MTLSMQMGQDFTAAWPSGESPSWVAVPGGWSRPVGDGAATGALRPVEWAALRARFLALHALRQAIPAPAAAARATGAFGVASEAVLAECRNPGAVNPVCWANQKDDSVKTRPVAASPTRGDRGMA